MSFIDSKINLAQLKVLDVGCGGGILTEAMAHRGAQVTGIDMGEALWLLQGCIYSRVNWKLTTSNLQQKHLPKNMPENLML